MNTKFKFSPSLMCMNIFELEKQLSFFNKNADFLHVDIMDGHFVKNITLSPSFIDSIRELATIPIDAHLMVENPADYIDELVKFGTSFITVHTETINNEAFRVINRIKEKGCKVGIALNPATMLEETKYYIGLVDKVTIMTVDPGYAGQKFISEMLEKIKLAKAWKEQYGYQYLIEVDGSCNEKTFRVLSGAGTEVFVVGSSGLFNLHKDIEKAWDEMIRIFEREVRLGQEKNKNQDSSLFNQVFQKNSQLQG